MILHLFDDEKVVNRAISLFEEALPGNNIFVCKIQDCPKYIKEQPNLYFYNNETFELEKLQYVDKVIVHMLTSWKIDFLKRYVTSSYKLYWIIWGGDMYNGLISHLGYNIYYEPSFLSPIWKLESFIIYVLFKTKIKIGSLNKVLKFVSQVDYFKTSLPEYEIQKKYLSNYMNGKPLPLGFNVYYCLEDILGKFLLDKSVNGNTIQIGNSASLSGNHVYVFKFLSKLNLRNRNISVPLSYGGNKRYINHVIEEGKSRWGDCFHPILDFMELPKYNDTMLRSDIFLFGNWRQEAVGNILVALYLGAKVFLSKNSPLLQVYTDMGIKVFCLELINQQDLDIPLEKIFKEQNRRIVGNMLNKQTLLTGIKSVWK